MSESTPPNPPETGGSVERYGIRIEIPEPFLQKHLEDFQSRLMALGKGDIANAVYRGAIVRAGIQCGWVSGMAEHEIPEMAAYKIEWASARIHGLVSLARKVRPE